MQETLQGNGEAVATELDISHILVASNRSYNKEGDLVIERKQNKTTVSWIAQIKEILKDVISGVPHFNSDKDGF